MIPSFPYTAANSHSCYPCCRFGQGRVSKMPAPTIENNTFGTLEIGSSLAVFLFGILTLQTCLCFTRFGKDRVQIQALVYRKIVQWLDATDNPFTTDWHSLVKRPPIPFSILLDLVTLPFQGVWNSDIQSQ
jgi:hypothetical protein